MIKLKRRKVGKHLSDVLDGIDQNKIRLQFCSLVLIDVIASWAVILTPLCFYGDFTMAEVSDYRRYKGFTYFDVRYYVENVEYKVHMCGTSDTDTSMSGNPDTIEICYWPKHPWICDKGQHIRRIRHKWNITPKI